MCTYKSVGEIRVFYFYVYMCAFVCLNAMHMNADAGQKKALNPWALEPRVVVSPLTWALRMEPRSYRRAASALKP